MHIQSNIMSAARIHLNPCTIYNDKHKSRVPDAIQILYNDLKITNNLIKHFSKKKVEKKQFPDVSTRTIMQRNIDPNITHHPSSFLTGSTKKHSWLSKQLLTSSDDL